MAATSTALGYVKELSEHVGSCSAAVPSIFLTRNQADAEAVADIKMEIPSIDFRLLREGNPDERLQTVRDLGRAFEEWGCFTLVNHGVSERLQSSMVKAFMEFFDQTPEVKHVYDMKQIFDPVCHGTSSNFRSKSNEQHYWRDYLRIFVHPKVHSPATPAGFRTVLEEYVQQTREVLNELLRAVWESLELEQSIMEDSLQLKSSNQILVGNFFPPCPQSELVLGFPPHTDATLLSVLVQNNSFNALQVMHDGKWVVVDLMPPTLLILPGDFMEIVSNGRYKSTLHRVVVSNEHTRISVGTSISPPFEGVFIAPAPELLRSSNNPAMFRSVTFKEYVTLKRNKNLTDSILDLLKL